MKFIKFISAREGFIHFFQMNNYIRIEIHEYKIRFYFKDETGETSEIGFILKKTDSGIFEKFDIKLFEDFLISDRKIFEINLT